MKYTIGTAAKATGKSKSTISRDIKSGRISAVHKDDGSYEIDAAELHRVYLPVSRNGTGNSGIEQSATSTETGVTQARLEAAEREAVLLKEQHDRERRQLETVITDLRTDRDHWRQQATALLTDQRPAQETKAGFWQRLFSRS